MMIILIRRDPVAAPTGKRAATIPEVKNVDSAYFQSLLSYLGLAYFDAEDNELKSHPECAVEIGGRCNAGASHSHGTNSISRAYRAPAAPSKSGKSHSKQSSQSAPQASSKSEASTSSAAGNSSEGGASSTNANYMVLKRPASNPRLPSQYGAEEPPPSRHSQLYYINTSRDALRSIKISVFTEDDLRTVKSRDKFDLFCDATYAEDRLTFSLVSRKEFENVSARQQHAVLYIRLHINRGNPIVQGRAGFGCVVEATGCAAYLRATWIVYVGSAAKG